MPTHFLVARLIPVVFYWRLILDLWLQLLFNDWKKTAECEAQNEFTGNICGISDS